MTTSTRCSTSRNCTRSSSSGTRRTPIRKRLAALADDTQKPKHQAILAFLETQLGLEALTRTEGTTAVSRFESAIELDAGAIPAYLNLGDVQRQRGRLDAAMATWEQVIDIAPERAYLVFDRIEAVTSEQGDTQRFRALCHRLIDANPQDWRARLALGRHLATRGAAVRGAGPAV